MRSSEPISWADVPISDKPKQSPQVLPVKPANALVPAPVHAPAAATVATPFNVSASMAQPTFFAVQATSLPVAQPITPSNFQSASIGTFFLDTKSHNNSPTETGHLRPAGVLNKAHQNLTLFSSETSALTEVPISDKSKQILQVLPDKPANALAPATVHTPATATATTTVATPFNVSAGLAQPISFAAQATSLPAAQPISPSTFQSASIGTGFMDTKSPKNLPTDTGQLRSMEFLNKVSMDIGGSVKLGQSVGFKEFKDFENDRGLTVTIGSSQISLDVHTGSNLPQQVVGTEAVSPAFNQDAQWTSNLADTVNQWVERSLQLAELTVPDAGQDSLQVRIELNGQEATVYFLTDHAQYRDAIESQIENLSDRLADQGLKLAGSFVGQGSSQNSPQEQSAHSMLSRRHESEPASAKVLSIDPVLRDLKSVHQGRVLDVFA